MSAYLAAHPAACMLISFGGLWLVAQLCRLIERIWKP